MRRQPVSVHIPLLHSLGLHAPHLCGLRHRLDRVGVELTPTVAGLPHHEDRGLVEEPVEGARQRVVAREELVPRARRDFLARLKRSPV